MRLILLVMLLGCALAASTNRVRRNQFEKGNRPTPPPKEGPDIEDENRPRVRRANPFEEGNRPRHATTKPATGEEDIHDRVRRAAPATWPGGKICYVFSSNFDEGKDDNMRKHMKDAMAAIESVSCVQFVEADTGESSCTSSTQQKLEIKNDEEGCWAFLGCQSTINCLNVAPTCDPYDMIGVLIHEIFHSIGRQHEQNRPDRDAFVEIMWDNINVSQSHNFKKGSSDDFETFQLDYDYESIMHYGKSFFAIDKSQPTLRATNSNFENKIGKQEKLSPGDVKYLNNMYECYDGVPRPCERGGARKGGTDKSCYCVDPFEGDDCEKMKTGVVVIENNGTEAKTVESLNFPGNYPLDTTTHTLLECTDPTMKVQIEVIEFAIEEYGCYYDNFQYTIMSGDVYPETKCGSALKGKTVTSTDNTMVITMISDHAYQYKGFQISFTCVNGG